MIKILTNKIVNPTPFDVEIEWNRGVILKVAADSELELSMEQLNDFRPGQPGSEEVKQITDYFGLFLLDGDRSWEEQAVHAIEDSLKAKKAQVEGFVNRVRDSRISQGSPVDDAAMDEILRTSGQDKIREQCESLDKRLKFLRKLLGEKGTKGKVKETLDPKRTCFITQPPRQFPSEAALELFLMDQSPEFRAKHEEYKKSMVENG